MKRVACIYFPNWSVQRRLASRPPDDRRPLLVGIPGGGGLPCVRACCHRAHASGVQIGMPIAEARALVEPAEARDVRREIEVVDDDPARDREVLLGEAEYGWRYTPLVGVEPVGAGAGAGAGAGGESILANVTGCAHLCGGEASLGARLHGEWTGRGYRVRVALAGSIGSAWAVAHAAEWAGLPQRSLVVPPGREWDWLERLPVTALRLPQRVLADLAELDLLTVKTLLAIPLGSLRSRFGEEVLNRIEQAVGRRPEPLVCLPMPDPITAERDFEYPLRNRELVEEVMRELLGEVCEGLKRRGRHAGRVVCRVAGSGAGGGDSRRWEVELVEPTGEAGHLWELLRLKAEREEWPPEVHGVQVTAEEVVVARRRQETLFESDSSAERSGDLARLFERLGSRLGRDAVLQPTLTEEAVPEQAAELAPAAAGSPPSSRQDGGLDGEREQEQERDGRLLGPGRRPLRLLPEPVAIEVMAVDLEGPPIRFAWRGRECRVVRHWGPERIETGWWQRDGVARDYYRVETDGGEWFWLFRRRGREDWFVHGIFE